MLVTPCLEHRGKPEGEEQPSETSARNIGTLCPSLPVTLLTKQRQSRKEVFVLSHISKNRAAAA